MVSFAKRFGMEIRKEREKHKLSQEEFAAMAGIHRTYISSIELGKVDPSLGVAKRVARALGMKLSEIISKAE